MNRKQWRALQSLLSSPEKLEALWRGLHEQSLPDHNGKKGGE